MSLLHLNPYRHTDECDGGISFCPACEWARHQEGRKVTLEWRDGKLWESSDGVETEAEAGKPSKTA